MNPNPNSQSSTPPTSPSAQSDPDSTTHPGVLLDLSFNDSELILSALINAVVLGHLKITEAVLDAVQKLIAHGYLRGEANPTWAPDAKLLSKLIGSVCKCHDLGDDAVELLVIKSILSAVTSVLIRIHGDSLLQVVRTCYDICLESKNVVNQTTAKASLGFITKVLQDIDRVFNAGTLRVGATPTGACDEAFETTTSTVESTNPADLLDSTDKDMLDVKYWGISMYKTTLEGQKRRAGGQGGRKG
ncbi:hypothetical protein CQW23_19496 [Capsicum baccatum]|uniref:Mon2/Sec7/BIG1-like dimerisation and cyclophilin-binding domain-containing protein n=1 Tax=Capsicum baccatum TaxID=33114 RepID=A0A2G2W5Y9_CAPBA|nr:hypothetical protein CQW23_19496 [Capsicum baccatum]